MSRFPLPPWLPAAGANAPLFQAIDRVLGEVPEALEVLDWRRAEGEWLDVWGSLLGVLRDGEADEPYRRRILASIFLPRNTLEAIRNALQTIYGPSVRVVDGAPGWAESAIQAVLADGLVDAGLGTWPYAPPDPSAARFSAYLGERPLEAYKNPILDMVCPAGVLPARQIAPVFATVGHSTEAIPLTLPTRLANEGLVLGSTTTSTAYSWGQASSTTLSVSLANENLLLSSGTAATIQGLAELSAAVLPVVLATGEITAA